MGDARHPKDYNEGPRKQMTRAWKLRVQDKLDENRKSDVEPSTITALARDIGADKAGLHRTLDPDGEQTASSYVDAICLRLDIVPPLEELTPTDDELSREIEEIRRMPADEQQKLLELIRLWKKR